ncbi:MAG: type 1 glutamine amidotransferase family protein [Bacteroidales bacterium]
MKQEILFVLLNDFADWEGSYIAPCLNNGLQGGRESQYIVKTVSITKEPVMSCGGMRILPDYDLSDIPANFAGVILIGGTRWFTPEAELMVPLVTDALARKRMVAGICNGSVFLGKHGFLNEVNHTSNGLEYLQSFAGINYTGEAHYVDAAAIRDKNIVTANGFSALEFCREILYALDADTAGNIERNYRMNKTGVWEYAENE